MDISGIVGMTPTEFFGMPNGSHVYNHGADQCVALANEFHEGVLSGAFVPVNSAYQWWTQFNNYATLRDNYTQVTGNPIRGDIFVGRYGPYQAANGHIGIVERAWNGQTFGTMEQGIWAGGFNQYVTRLNRNMDYVLGFLRPNNQQLINPTIPVTSKDKTKMLICHTMDGRTADQGPEYLLFGTDFYQGFGGEGKYFESQIGGQSMPVSRAFIDSVKAFIDGGRK